MTQRIVKVSLFAQVTPAPTTDKFFSVAADGSPVDGFPGVQIPLSLTSIALTLDGSSIDIVDPPAQDALTNVAYRDECADALKAAFNAKSQQVQQADQRWMPMDLSAMTVQHHAHWRAGTTALAFEIGSQELLPSGQLDSIKPKSAWLDEYKDDANGALIASAGYWILFDWTESF